MGRVLGLVAGGFGALLMLFAVTVKVLPACFAAIFVGVAPVIDCAHSRSKHPN